MRGDFMPTLLPAHHKYDRLEPAPNRKRWTRAECEFLVQSELLTGRYELIDGEVLFKMGQKPPHALVITLMTAWLTKIFGERYIRCQLTMDVAETEREYNEPEPDVVVLNKPITEFYSHHPVPAEVLLVVEVSDTTLRFDLKNKALLYARAGISDYWAADLAGRRIVVHRKPDAEGYTEVLEYGETEILSPLSYLEAQIQVSDLLPPLA
jgi:Uma2 family endonuclease